MNVLAGRSCPGEERGSGLVQGRDEIAAGGIGCQLDDRLGSDAQAVQRQTDVLPDLRHLCRDVTGADNGAGFVPGHLAVRKTGVPGRIKAWL